tara:strand:- start:7 stop:495 length:489 start_codon:yes stop_codon:yes gene_type:complete
MSSPFQLKSPIKYSLDDPKSYSNESTAKSAKDAPVVKAVGDYIETNNADGSKTEYNTEESSPDKNVAKALEETKKPLFKEGAFDNDGRSDEKFKARIAKADKQGRFGKAQRLKNRHASYLEKQGDKAKNAGGTLSPDQQKRIDEAKGEAGGTQVGKFLRSFK